jgi:hypothetical protein
MRDIMLDELTDASVAFLLEHRRYPGCTMASLTIREWLADIEAAVRDATTEALGVVAARDTPAPVASPPRWLRQEASASTTNSERCGSTTSPMRMMAGREATSDPRAASGHRGACPVSSRGRV